MSSAEAEVLAANQAFYDAFARGDMVVLEALWAEKAAVACIHPGWDALVGRDEVLQSFRSILGGGGAPAVKCLRPTATVMGEAAFVVCAEALGDVELVATNLFVQEGGCWRLVHHHSGPVHRRTERRPPPAPSGSMLN